MKAATVYGRIGWRVLPLRPGAKIPAISDWPNQATDDAAQITKWIEEFPDHNIGAATGHTFFALDVDPRNGGDTTLAALVETHGELPPTVQAATPSGGTHYLFAMVPGLTNSAGKLGQGLDIRAAGGQIAVSPSRTAAGVYRWIRAPWNTEIAEAPAWLIEALRTRNLDQGAPKSTLADAERGFFPAASADVLAEAAEALRQHGPAIQGSGGDLHTFRAGALLVHDFALTFDEAWPLFAGWNRSCKPPWAEGELRAKLQGGEKYGTAAYGCRRTLDVMETARKMIRDWEAGDRSETVLLAALKKIRDLPVDDPAKKALIERDLTAATGLTRQQLGLPKARAPIEKPATGQILVTPKLHEVADAAIEHVAPHIFQRSGVLCEVVSTGGRTFISDLEPKRILDLMSQTATYVRQDEDGLTTQAPPENVAAILHARRTHKVRVIEGVTTAPVFLADGSILQVKGYNEQARVYLDPSVFVDVPEAPTQSDARAAVAVFEDLLCDFLFSSSADFSSWLAGLLSPLCKAATANAPTPLICVSASSPGAGKTLLVDVIARIVNGGPAEVRSYSTRDVGEWIKKITSFVKAASPISVFDNVNGAIGDEALDRLITSATWSDRILGVSDAPPMPNVTTWFATGNNIEPHGDTVRRVLVCRIVVETERPQERTNFKRPLLADYASEHRSELLSAALTILRAYHLAGRPDQRLAAWGSFGAWSSLVRGAIVWAGLPDPFQTQQRASNDLNEPENEAHDFWISVIEDSDGTAASIVLLANQRDAQGTLGCREPITALYLRRFVGRFVDKPRAGRRIRKDRDAKRNQTRYYVEPI